MRWIIVCVLLTMAVPVWAQPGVAKNKVAQPSKSDLWNQKLCPQGIEDLGNLLTLNPYDSKGRCFNYVGRLVQLLSKNTAFFSFMTDTTPFALVDFGKDSVPMGPFYGVVQGKGAYSYQTVSGSQNIILSFMLVPKSKERDVWDRKKVIEEEVDKAESRVRTQTRVEQEWMNKIENSNNPKLIAAPFSYTDPVTGLMWARIGNIAEMKMNWKDAMQWAKTLNYGGYSDWRLPTKEEFETIIKNSGDRSFPCKWLNNNGFYRIQCYSYWSSSGYDNSGSFWYADMERGEVHAVNDSHYYVWPVRDGNMTNRDRK